MDFELFKKAAVDEAQKLGLTEYELYCETMADRTAEGFGHELRSFSDSTTGGVSFRCSVDGHLGSAATQDMTEAAARQLVRQAVENGRFLESDDKAVFAPAGGAYAPCPERTVPAPDTADLVKTVLSCQEALYAADPLTRDGCESSVTAFERTVAIVNSNGVDLSQKVSGCMAFAVSVLQQGEELEDNYEIASGPLAEMDIRALAKKAAAGARAKLGADVASTGTCPVVFSPKAMRSLLGVYFSVFSADNARKGMSRLMDKEGQVIAAETVTLVDDPFYKDAAFPCAFDGEGSPTYTKNIIEKGVLKTLLFDLKTAAALGRTTTGNGARRGYDSPVAIMPTNLYLAPGTLTEDELLEKAGNGVYIDFLGGLHAGADPISGDFSLQSGGFVIENGKKTRPVKSFTVAGNFYDLLKNVAALSDKVDMPASGSSISIGSPAVLLEAMSIAGK
ncbi:MAG: TldD/PmbA family protein [Oscillospiraceae bacterium]|nr:TldD/PmbA family protein [Oscillospiraceae bacterium]